MLGAARNLRGILTVAIVAAMPLMSGGSAAAAGTSVEKLQEFSLDQVQITDTYQMNLFSKDVTYLITTLDSDRLLAGFKAVSTGTTPTNSMDTISLRFSPHPSAFEKGSEVVVIRLRLASLVEPGEIRCGRSCRHRRRFRRKCDLPFSR